MPALLAVGAAILDLVYVLDELPVIPQKYRAKSLGLRGGSSRFRGRAGIPSRTENYKASGGQGLEQFAQFSCRNAALPENGLQRAAL